MRGIYYANITFSLGCRPRCSFPGKETGSGEQKDTWHVADGNASFRHVSLDPRWWSILVLGPCHPVSSISQEASQPWRRSIWMVAVSPTPTPSSSPHPILLHNINSSPFWVGIFVLAQPRSPDHCRVSPPEPSSEPIIMYLNNRGLLLMYCPTPPRPPGHLVIDTQWENCLLNPRLCPGNMEHQDIHLDVLN